MRLRNTLPLLLALAVGSAWAIDPLVGPGKVGEKDPDAGAGPHLGFTEQYERRVDRPEQAVEKEQKEKAGKAKKDEKTASKPKS